MRQGAKASADADGTLTAALRRPFSASIDCLACRFTGLSRSENVVGLAIHRSPQEYH